MMGRPKKNSPTVVTEQGTNETPIEGEEAVEQEAPNELNLFPMWDYAVGESKRQATVRTLTEFVVTTEKGIGKEDAYLWGWKALLKFSEELYTLSEGNMQITLTIPPHIRERLEA